MLKILIYLILGIILLFFYIKFLERKGIYFPTKEIEVSPQERGLHYEELWIKTKDGFLLNAWFIPHPKARFTLIFSHGNAGNISHRIEKIALLYNLGLNILIFDYRGYGKSQGAPGEKGFYKDIEAVYLYAVEERKIPPERIILYGESLGTAVSVKLASERKVKAIILEGAFSCGRDMAKMMYPFLPNFFFGNSFDSLSRIKKITSHKLFLHSREDEVVPFSLALKLYQKAPSPKKLVELKGSHNGLFWDDQEAYLKALNSFLDELGGLK